MKLYFFFFTLWGLLPCSKIHANNEKVFTRIYQHKEWAVNKHGEGNSGIGSTEEATKEYRAFLQIFFEAFHIKSVVDFGCGDWEFSQLIDWNGMHYTGFDVVKPVVEKNQKKFEKDNIKFVHADGLSECLPKADLLICKEVLQHLSNEDILKFMNQMNKFKFCLLVNDVQRDTHSSPNPNIISGDYRCLDVTKPPFNIKGIVVLTYSDGFNLKQVLLVCPPL